MPVSLIGQAQRAIGVAVRLRMNSIAAVHLRRGQRIDFRGNFEQRFQHEWRERLPGAQQAVGLAMPSAIRGLLAPQVRGASRQCRPFGLYDSRPGREATPRSSSAASVRSGLGQLVDRLAVGEQRQDGGAGDGDAAGNAVMSGPGAVFVLHLEDLGLDVGVPLLPFRPAGAMQAVADVEIREEFLAADGAEAAMN